MNALLITFYGLIVILIVSYVLSLHLKRLERQLKRRLGKLTAGKLDTYVERNDSFNIDIRKYLKLTNEF